MSLFIIDCLKSQIDDIKENYIPKDILNKTKKCIIIGSNVSIKSGNYGEYIDNNEAFIVRINREPEEIYYKYYGKRTDLFITHGGNKTLNIRNKYKNAYKIPNYFIPVQDRVVNHQPKYRWATTGFYAICLMAGIFDEIELLGFGYTQREFADNHFHYLNNIVHKTWEHDLILEDKLINRFQKMFKVYRCEERQSKYWNHIVVIPARSKSKTVPNKNMRMFGDKPLLDYTIDAIKPFNFQTYILTDSVEYGEYAKSKGIDYILEDEIGSSTKMDENLLPYIYPRFKNHNMILLQPTSPLRLFGIIDECLKQYDGHSLLTVEEIGSWLYKNNSQNLMIDRFNRPLKQSPDFNTYYYFDGNILIRNINEWANDKCLVNDSPVLVKNSRINTLQIDTMDDVQEFENILKITYV